MIQINVNLVGIPTDTPTLTIDNAPTIYQATIVSSSRAFFALADTEPSHGCTVHWAGQTRSARTVVPARAGSYEGGLLNPPLPDLTYELPALTGLTIEGDHFLLKGRRFYVKGSTDFRIPEQAMVGADFEAILDDRIAVGCNWFRMLSMKKNNTGYRLDPRDPRHEGAIRKTFDALGTRGVFGQWCVFADTGEMMRDPYQQHDYWARQQEILQPYRAFALIEFCNEASHASQSIQPINFAPPAGFLASHGSETADKHPVRPVWNWAGYSARRSGPLGKIISNYAPLTAFETWPPYCYIPQETIKPDESYGHDPVVAATLGHYARTGTGGLYHHNAWRDCRRFTDGERVCARAFYTALEE